MCQSVMDQVDGCNGSGKFQRCLAPGCNHKIEVVDGTTSPPFCPRCKGLLGKSLQRQLDADLERVNKGQEPDELLSQACIDELRNQHVEQVKPSKPMRR
jgi:hypothetical protein